MCGLSGGKGEVSNPRRQPARLAIFGNWGLTDHDLRLCPSNHRIVLSASHSACMPACSPRKMENRAG